MLERIAPILTISATVGTKQTTTIIQRGYLELLIVHAAYVTGTLTEPDDHDILVVIILAP